MKPLTLCAALCLLFLSLNAQLDKKIADTSFIIGTFKKDVESFNSKTFKHHTFYRGLKIVIYNATVTGSVGAQQRAFEVIYNGDLFTINAEDLITNPLDAYDQMIELSDKQLSVFQDRSWEYAAALKDLQLDEALKYLKSKGTAGLLVESWSLTDASEYTQGTGLEFKILNPSKKTVKYVWFTVVGKNDVGDVVSTKTVRGIGPVEYLNTASWKFDYVWFTDVVTDGKLNQIKVQYMDGSYRTILHANITVIPDIHVHAMNSLE